MALPRLGRRARLALFLVTLIALTLVLWPASILGAAPAGAGTPGAPGDAWPFAWRPYWIPGDPIEDGAAGAPGSVLVLGLPLATPGFMVALDPATRRPVVPSAQQRAAASAALEAAGLSLTPDEALPVEQLPGGGRLIHLNGRFQVFSVARRDADGRFIWNCAPDPAAARQLLAQPAPVARRWEEK